jgi:hypothetical protein
MFDAKIIEGAQSCPGKVTEFRMIALCLEFADNSYRNDDFMLFKSFYRTGVCQKYRGI